jgi:hypothetical protein
MHYIAWVENLVFIICFDKSVLCATVGVVMAAAVRPTVPLSVRSYLYGVAAAAAAAAAADDDDDDYR